MTDATTPAIDLVFSAPPPGFFPMIDFTLAPIPGADGLYTLRSADDPNIRLFVVDADSYVPDYSPSVPADALFAIGTDRPEGVQVLVITTASSGAPTVNLMAPILVNRATGQALQVILDGDEWPIRAELLRPAS